jgi:hypothetical protein
MLRGINMYNEKQIKEMARAVDGGCKEDCENCNLNGGCTNLWWAKEFYNAGYRKQINDACKKCEDWKYERLWIGYKFCPYCGRILDT